MLSHNIFHLVWGVVSLKAENGFVERFINLCTACNIPLWDMQKKDGILYAKTSIRGYRHIRPAARQSGMKVRITEKKGLPFFMNRRIKKKGLIPGFAILFISLFLLSGHIWTIEVTGNRKLKDSEIISAFSEAGLYIGRRTKGLPLTEIETDVLLENPEIYRASVNIKGSTALIEIRESEVIPEPEKEGIPSNIIASGDGQVQIIEPYRGTPAVRPGETVRKGELLISGITEMKNGTTVFSEAKGYAVASTFLRTEKEYSLYPKLLDVKKEKDYSVFFLGGEMSIKKIDKKKPCYLHKSVMNIDGKDMPFGIYCRTRTQYSENKNAQAPDINVALLCAVRNFLLETHRENLHLQIIKSDIKLKKESNSIKITGNYFAYENIGISVPVNIEELPEEQNMP